MSNVVRTTVWMNGNIVEGRKVTKAKIDTVMKTILGDKSIAKQKLYVGNGYVSLETDFTVVSNPDSKYYGMNRITTLSIPLRGETLKNLSEYHYEYYEWLTTSGRANGASLLRVIRLTSPKYRAKVGPLVDSIDTIGEILGDFGIRNTNDFYHRALSQASKKQMDAIFKVEDLLHSTASFLLYLKEFEDLTDANGKRLGNDPFILSLLNSASKRYTLTEKQIQSGERAIYLYKMHSKQNTAIPEWRFASADKNIHNKKEISMSEKSLRSKIIRLAHAKPHLRSHLLPLVTKTAYQKLRESASYEEMQKWKEEAIKLYNQDRIDLGDVLFPLTMWYQDVHSAIEDIAGSKRRGGVGMSARQLLKWYDEN